MHPVLVRDQDVVDRGLDETAGRVVGRRDQDATDQLGVIVLAVLGAPVDVDQVELGLIVVAGLE